MTYPDYLQLHRLSQNIERMEGELRALREDQARLLAEVGLRLVGKPGMPPVSGRYHNGQRAAVLEHLAKQWASARDIVSLGLASREYTYPLLARLYSARLVERRKTQPGPYEYRAVSK